MNSETQKNVLVNRLSSLVKICFFTAFFCCSRKLICHSCDLTPTDLSRRCYHHTDPSICNFGPKSLIPCVSTSYSRITQWPHCIIFMIVPVQKRPSNIRSYLKGFKKKKGTKCNFDMRRCYQNKASTIYVYPCVDVIYIHESQTEKRWSGQGVSWYQPQSQLSISTSKPISLTSITLRSGSC